ncbi:MAG TPA: hypothetical protein VE442_25525 [Jatrophihabitans sp.]|jgi:Tfp pilus assembly protein PilN|nr:hypothetical protein [Jatrophihabitans sp.]
MTAITSPPKTLWATMPGWGIAANLLPPEIITARRVRVLRKTVAIVLAAVVLLCASGYVYARWQSHTASTALRSEQARTAELQQQEGKYNDVVQMERSVAGVQAQIASLLGNDVDVPRLITAMLRQLPAGATVSQLDVTFASGTSSTSGSTSTSDGSVLDTSGLPHIGTVTLTGQARNIGDVARFATSVAGLRGVVEAYPTSQQSSADGVQFNIALTLTDQVLSHRYSVTGISTSGGN